jgi:hypothetical protein
MTLTSSDERGEIEQASRPVRGHNVLADLYQVAHLRWSSYAAVSQKLI